jgi:hypothetical protein
MQGLNREFFGLTYFYKDLKDILTQNIFKFAYHKKNLNIDS